MNSSQATTVNPTTQKIRAGLKKRYAAERRFQFYGMAGISIAVIALLILFVSIGSKGYTAFVQTHVELEVFFDEQIIDPSGERKTDELSRADYAGVVKATLRARFPEVKNRRDKRQLYGLISTGAAFDLREMVMTDPSIIGTTQRVELIASDDVDMLIKGHIHRDTEESARPIKDKQIAWIEQLEEAGAVSTPFNERLFSRGDSREPELAGIWGAIVGSFYTMLVTLTLSFPLGVAAAIYLEEFAHKSKLAALIEVNINNLAAVPSIVFGLLGLAVFLNFFQMPRSAPLVGGVVLALMTFPTIIIAGRAALKSVPPSIREAAAGLGASRTQVVFHHVLPLAMPGILTGTIIGMARAVGETAPLLMIGMVAFIVDIPQGISDPASVLPVQVYLWADAPERAFVERTSATTMVLLGFLIAMNAAAVMLRKKFERRW